MDGFMDVNKIYRPWYEPVEEECMEPVQLLFLFHQVCSGWWWAGLILMWCGKDSLLGLLLLVVYKDTFFASDMVQS